jgi:hypothetical protein
VTVPVLERNFSAHFAIRKEGIVHPLCKSWRTTWNWTLERDHVTCTFCREALEKRELDAPAA